MTMRKEYEKYYVFLMLTSGCSSVVFLLGMLSLVGEEAQRQSFCGSSVLTDCQTMMDEHFSVAKNMALFGGVISAFSAFLSCCIYCVHQIHEKECNRNDIHIELMTPMSSHAECVICLEDTHEPLCKVRGCRCKFANFHPSCLNKWFSATSEYSCPICKYQWCDDHLNYDDLP